MDNYKPFLIQKLKAGSPVRDSNEWGILVKSIPFKIFPDMKKPASRNWADENGDDEFLPDNPVFEAYELECEFLFIGGHGTANQSIKDFLLYLSFDGVFKIYDTYTKIGRTNVRYAGFSEKALYRRDQNEDMVIFSVKLKVNDPITDIHLTPSRPSPQGKYLGEANI